MESKMEFRKVLYRITVLIGLLLLGFVKISVIWAYKGEGQVPFGSTVVQPVPVKRADPRVNAVALLAVGELETIDVPEGPFEAEVSSKASLFTGRINYTLPIMVPHGIHGFVPTVSLDYHGGTARSRAGIVRLGWEVTANYITRNVEDTPSNLSDDSFRLVLSGRSYDLIYLSSDGRYHTKIESDLHIEYVSSGAPNTYGGYWIVRDKDGTRYRFGYTADAESTCQGRSHASNWYLDEVRDTNNNHIYYSYSESPHSEDIGATYPTKIEYNNDRTRVVEFVYEMSVYVR